MGIVASGAGLASLAIQLADSVMKLRRFCNSVLEAPQDLKDLIFEIETLSLTLHQIEQDQGRYPSIDTELVGRCLEMCRSGTNKINAVAEKLKKRINKRPLLGAVKVALEERHIRGLLEKLESAKVTLLLAYQMYMQEVQRQKLEEIHGTQETQGHKLDEVHVAIISFNPAKPPETQSPQKGDDEQQAASELRCRRRKHASTAERHKGPDPFLRLRLPVINVIWQMGAARASSGWTVHLSTYNVRPRNSQIFELCKMGDLEGVQKLIWAKEASVYDRCENDYIDDKTPLEVRT